MNKYPTSGWLVVLSILVLSVACSKEQPIGPVCAMAVPPESEGSEEFEKGNPTLTVAAALGTALEIGEDFYPSVETYQQSYLYDYAGCSAPEDYYVGAIPPQSVGFEECSRGVAKALNRSGRTNGIMMEQYEGQLSYFNSSQEAFCPQSWKHFLHSPQSNLVRQFRYLGTGPSAQKPISLSASTGMEILGWDPDVTLTPTLGKNYGFNIFTSQRGIFRSQRGAILKIHGANYQTPKWSHTVSSGDLRVKINSPDGSKVVLNSGDQVVIVQENFRRFTAKAKVTNLSWDYSETGCGCLPKSGKIETSVSGEEPARETVTFSGCGIYEIKRLDAKGNLQYTSRGKLNYCL